MNTIGQQEILRIGFTYYIYQGNTNADKLHFLQHAYPTCTGNRCRCERRRYHLPQANLILDFHVKQLDRRRRRLVQFYPQLDEPCSICYNSYLTVNEKVGPVVRLYPCKHTFHQECFFSWYKHCNPPLTCPYCRQNIKRVQVPLSRDDFTIIAHNGTAVIK